MKTIRKHLEALRIVRRNVYHPLVHKIHRKHKISRKTLFYIKEYGPHTNVSKTIIKESIKILLFASIISSFGGLALEYVKEIFLSFTPLIILLPVLNDMIGDYGTIVSSRFSTMLHEGKIRKKLLQNLELRRLILQISIISIATTILSVIISLFISGLPDYSYIAKISFKIFLIAIIDTLLLLVILFLIAISFGLYFYRKGEDPNNFLIPLSTSVADFGNMIILSILVILFF